MMWGIPTCPGTIRRLKGRTTDGLLAGQEGTSGMFRLDEVPFFFGERRKMEDKRFYDSESREVSDA